MLWGALSHVAQAQESELHGPPLKIENVDQVARDILDLYDASSEQHSDWKIASDCSTC